MSLILIVIFCFYQLQNHLDTKIDFGKESRIQRTWVVINDNVMGGVSSGRVIATDSSIIWDGYISFENNGGFSAFRSQLGDYDLSTFSEVRIKYRSAGQALDFALYPYRAYYMPNYKVHLGDTEGI